ncbi:hypothetical protein GCQ56_19150, partial [Marinifilum sp. N1E240]|uniref:beta strand repeat-containing protein n=1 Tax=Marinifilum sp. N1E240 TaxID=2608082 RepID=UPI00128B1FB4
MKREVNRIMHPQRNIKLKGFQILFFVVFLFITNHGLGQTTLHTVDFETDGSGYTVSPSESNANTSNPDYWIRTNGITPAIFPTYGFTTSNGDYFFAIEDLDYDGGATKHIITCDAVTVSGYSNLQIKLLVGGTTGTQTIEPTKFLKIEYNMDGGGWVTRAQFIGDNTNYRYYEDENADGTIDGPALLSALSEFTYSIPVTGSSLQVRFHFYCGGSEELAIDDIRVLGVSANASPTASNFTASPIYQGTPYAFATADFAYSDSDSDPIDHVRITAVPGTGSLWVDSDASGTINGAESALSNGGTVSKANLDAGYLKYLNTSGTSSSFTFDVNDGTDYSVSTFTATLTVTPVPTIAFNATSSNGTEALASADLQVDLSAASGLTVTVDYTVTGTASSADYTLADGTLTLTAGDVNKNITITSIVNDLLDENNETVIVTLSNPTNATLGTNTVHTYTINDNDGTPTIAFNATSSNGTEALASANLQVDLSAASGLTVTVDYTVTGTATSADYTLADGTLTITAGDVNDNITIGSIVNDLLDENNETVIVTLSSPTNATLGTNTVHTYTINDNDGTPTIAFNATSSNGTEALASANLQVDLSAASGLTVTVDYTVTGTATSADYTLADGTLTITAGDVNDNITIASIVNDLLDENNETVIVTLSNPTNASLGTNTVHTYTINDNDALPDVSFEYAAQNSIGESGVVNMKIVMLPASGRDVSIPFTVNASSTATEGVDYTISSSPIVIPAGSENVNIVVNVVSDAFDEDNETLVVDMGAVDYAIPQLNTSQTLTLIDDDATPTIAFNATSSNGSEALASADLQVDLSAASGLTVTVDYMVTGTATGADYTLADGTLTLTAGDVNDNITIGSIVNDLLDENNETVIVTLSNPVNATLGTNTIHTYTINDND